MEVLFERVAGLDISKSDVKACVRVPISPESRRFRSEVRTFRALTRSLLEMSDWLHAERVELVVMEATGDYWKPAFYLLEELSRYGWSMHGTSRRFQAARPT